MGAKTNATKPAQDPAGGLDTIAPSEGTITVDGMNCRVKRLRMRELMKLVRVLTAGLGEGLTRLDWSSTSDEEFGQQLFGMALVGIPEAEDEFVELVQALVEPADPRYSEQVHEALDNPEAAVVVDAIGVVIEQERESFGLLLGKLRTLVGAASALRTKKTTAAS